MRSSEPEFVKAVVNTLRKDTTLPPLLPYFIKFISDEVKDNLRIISRLSNIMQMVDALCDSEDKNLHIEPYVCPLRQNCSFYCHMCFYIGNTLLLSAHHPSLT